MHKHAMAVDLVRPVYGSLDDILLLPRVRWCHVREMQLGQLVAVHELHENALYLEVLPRFRSLEEVGGTGRDVGLGQAQSYVGEEPGEPSRKDQPRCGNKRERSSSS